MDTSFEHVCNQLLNVDKALTIGSYQTVSPAKHAVLRFQFMCSSYDENYILKISKNVSFLDIEIVHTMRNCGVFFMVNPCQRIIIKQCNIITPQVDTGDTRAIFVLNFNLTEILVTDTNFFGQKTTNMFFGTFRKSVPKPFQRKAIKSIQGIVAFDRCSFVNNSFFFGCEQRKLFVSNSVFMESDVSVSMFKSYFINNNFTASSLTISDGDSSIEHCQFKGSSSNSIGEVNYLFQLNVKKTTYGVITDIKNCKFEKSVYGAVNLYQSDTTLRDTIFHDNTIILRKMMSTGRAAGITSYSGSLDILNCRFINNSAPPNQPGAIYSQNNGCEPPCVTFTIDNTTIISRDYPGSSDNTVFVTEPIGNLEVAWVSIGKGTEIQCQPNEFMYKQVLFLHYFKFHCKKCDGTRYNTIHAGYKNSEAYNVTCYDCPYQASCVNGIQSKGNYWGRSDPNSGKVTFTLCPASYCCKSLKNCTSYNTCGKNRKGRLCGDCENGYSLSLLSQNKCVFKTECEKQTVLWTMYLVVTITACFFTMYGADAWKLVISLLKKVSKRLIYKEKGDTDDSNSPIIEYEGNQQEPLIRNQINPSLTPPNNTEKNFTGMVKTTFFFYQTASIIRVQASAKAAYNMPGLIGLMTSFFNIKIDVTKGAVTLCPFDTSSVVIVEAFRSSVPLMSLLLILCVMVIVRAVMKLKNHLASKTQQTPSSSHVDSDSLLQSEHPAADHPFPPETNLPAAKTDFTCRLKGGYVNLMLLGYSSVALFSLRSVYCVNLDDSASEKTYLYVQASVECYQLWQQSMIAAILVWIAPFPIVLYIGCRLLRSHHITPNQFLVILTFPPACLFFCRGGHGRRNLAFQDEDIGKRTSEREHVLSVLNEPFRGTNKSDNNALIWEPVLIGRRLVLIFMTTFILSPILRLYPVGLVLVLFAIHDHLTKPYSSNHLNLLQFLSTLVLLLLLLLNMFWALSNDIDLVKKPEYFILGEIFIVLEVVVLVLPFIIALFYLAFKLIKCSTIRYCKILHNFY